MPPPPTVTIRPATSLDACEFPAVENSAGERFRDCADLAWLADGADHSAEYYRQIVEQGLSWAASTGTGCCIGFLCGGLAGGELHVWELAVRLAHQGQGIGRALIEAAVQEATRRGIPALTLTTFKHVAWNAPLYARLGFEVVPPLKLTSRLRSLMEEEARQGLPSQDRCCMRLDLAGLLGEAALTGPAVLPKTIAEAP